MEMTLDELEAMSTKSSDKDLGYRELFDSVTDKLKESGSEDNLDLMADLLRADLALTVRINEILNVILYKLLPAARNKNELYGVINELLKAVEYIRK